MTEGALHADLCRLLAKSFASPFWRLNSFLLTGRAGDVPPRDYVLSESMKAYTIDKLSPYLQQFLKLCARSADVKWELFQGKPTGLSLEEEDRKVVERMTEGEDMEAPEDMDEEDEE